MKKIKLNIFANLVIKKPQDIIKVNYINEIKKQKPQNALNVIIL
jgi:hypothetical protein